MEFLAEADIGQRNAVQNGRTDEQLSCTNLWEPGQDYRRNSTKHGLQSHLQETKVHVQRVEQILSQLNGKVDSKKSKGIAALITEGEDVIKDATDEAVRDAGIVAAAQKVEHFEMAAYGTVRNGAEILGKTIRPICWRQHWKKKNMRMRF